jgi:hypothetical protein
MFFQYIIQTKWENKLTWIKEKNVKKTMKIETHIKKKCYTSLLGASPSSPRPL